MQHNQYGDVRGFRQNKKGAKLQSQQDIINWKRNIAHRDAEVEDVLIDTSRTHQGGFFRLVFVLAVVFCFVALGLAKYEGERKRLHDVVETETTYDEEFINEFWQKANKEYKPMSEFDRAQETKEAKIQRWKETQRKAREIVEEREQKMKSGECDEECQKDFTALQVAHNQLSRVLPEDPYKTMGVTMESMSKSELRENYEKLKKEHADDPDALALYKTSYDVLIEPHARQYYNMYGMAPPKEVIQQARVPSMGETYGTSFWKLKMVLGWLSVFDSAELDIAALLAVVGVMFIPILAKPEMLRKFKDLVDENAPAKTTAPLRKATRRF